MSKLEQITLGAGCFWCIEAQFKALPGVKKVVSGYSGGETDNPTYDQVCSGKTGHAEVVQIDFDAKELPLDKLLQAFWYCHDPTELNKQGLDVGTQYRSVVFYHTEAQKDAATRFKAQLNEQKVFKKDIVTEIAPFKKFYVAEEYHKNYFENNKEQPYCKLNIKPKLEKFKKAFVL
jgi:peptide-methionine (S)-S-oxide reductase